MQKEGTVREKDRERGAEQKDRLSSWETVWDNGTTTGASLPDGLLLVDETQEFGF